MRFYYISRIAELHSRLDDSDGFVEAFSRGLDYADGVGVGCCEGADIVCLIEVPMIAVVVEGHVDVDDISVLEEALVGDAVADYFIDGSAD